MWLLLKYQSESCKISAFQHMWIMVRPRTCRPPILRFEFRLQQCDICCGQSIDFCLFAVHLISRGWPAINGRICELFKDYEVGFRKADQAGDSLVLFWRLTQLKCYKHARNPQNVIKNNHTSIVMMQSMSSLDTIQPIIHIVSRISLQKSSQLL